MVGTEDLFGIGKNLFKKWYSQAHYTCIPVGTSEVNDSHKSIGVIRADISNKVRARALGERNGMFQFARFVILPSETIAC